MYYSNLFDGCLLATFKLYRIEKLMSGKKQPVQAPEIGSIGNSWGRIAGLLASLRLKRQRKLNLVSVTR